MMSNFTSPPFSTVDNPLQFPIHQSINTLPKACAIANNAKSYTKTNSKISGKLNNLHETITQKPLISQSQSLIQMCKCGRRHFIHSIFGITMLHATLPSLCLALDEPTLSSMEMLKKFHHPRSDWYEEFYASVLNSGMREYEAEIAGYKSHLFDELRGQVKEVLEIGIGTGPNLKYYASTARLVYGVDPNTKMEKYAKGAAEAAGLSPKNFKFIQAVGEALPLKDASVDAVIGTLVLCSVNDVHRTLQEVKRVLKPGGLYLFIEHVAAKKGTSLRLVQRILNPLQELLADGCHLTRETGKYISEAGFSSVDSSTAYIPSFIFVNPHLYGIARK